MQDRQVLIHDLRQDLSKTEQEFFQLLVRVAHNAEDLVETAGKSPAHMAYNKAVEAYEKMIEAKLWLAQTLEAIGEVGEDMYIPEITEEEPTVS